MTPATDTAQQPADTGTVASSIEKSIENGVMVTSDMATIAAPIVAIYNPAAGAALAALAPIVKSFVVNEKQILLNLNSDMTDDQVTAALLSSKSANWKVKPLDTSTTTGD